ncbi:hypothetical protein HKD37_06G016257 [Glycine soja]
MIVCPSLVHPLITVSLPKKKDGPIARMCALFSANPTFIVSSSPSPLSPLLLPCTLLLLGLLFLSRTCIRRHRFFNFRCRNGFTYSQALNEENRLDLVNALKVAFKTGDFKWQVAFIGRLTDGFLATSYVSYSTISSNH